MILPAIDDNIIYNAYQAWRININDDPKLISLDDPETDHLFPAIVLLNDGYDLIGCTNQMCEKTFIFRTHEQAKQAYEKYEVGKFKNEYGYISGWWYSVDDFIKNLGDLKKWGLGKRQMVFTELATKAEMKLINERNNLLD